LYARSALRALLCALTLAVVSGLFLVPSPIGEHTPSASAAPNVCTNDNGYFWSTEQDMLDAEGRYCRSTYVVDPGIGERLSRAQLLSHAGLYLQAGFSRQWLWYAPTTTLHVPSGSTKEWTSCPPDSSRPIGSSCPLGSTLVPHFISFDFGYRTVDLPSFEWDNRFIVRGCGNTSYGISGGDPVPVITGFKFDDRNRNGESDGAGEPGVAGVTFQLFRVSSEFGDQSPGYVRSTSSDGNGAFAFALTGAGPGVYRVHEVVPSGWLSTTGVDRTVVVPSGAGGGTVAHVTFGDRPQTPPVADAGSAQAVDQTSAAGAAVTLDGSGSHDDDGDRLTYLWTGDFDTATGVSLTVTLPPGQHVVTLTVSDGIDSDSDTTTITVYPRIAAAGSEIAGVEGSTASGIVATFVDPDAAATADEYAATVEWGDGTASSAGTIVAVEPGTFRVEGAHVYTEEDIYAVTITIVDVDNAYNTASASTTATVADAPLAARGVDLISTNPVDTTVATFTDANPYGTVGDFTATIDWGDGSPVDAGTVIGSPGGTFAVTGSHVYATLGPKTITVSIVDDGGASAAAVSSVLLYAMPESGSFVIGDGNASVGSVVTYWGGQWSRSNTLSSGVAPASFKGFIDTPSVGVDGWTSDPGNSSHPPASVPSYLGVVVASRIASSGSTIVGDAPHLVVVRTDPGYAGDPGHAGTGTIIAVVR